MAERFTTQPLVIALAPAFGMLHDGISVFNANGITELPHRPTRTEEVPEFPGVIQAGGVPDDVIMDMVAINMGADDISVISLGEPAGQLTAKAVGFLRGDLAGDKGLPDGVGDHIIRPAPSAGLGEVLPLGKQELRVRDPAVTLEAADQPAAVRLLRILYIVDDVLDGLAHRPALASVQGFNACGSYTMPSFTKGTAHDPSPSFNCSRTGRQAPRPCAQCPVPPDPSSPAYSRR